MIKQVLQASVVLFVPSLAMAYTVTLEAGPVENASTRFEQADFPTSTFVERSVASTATTSEKGSSFALLNVESGLREKTQSTLSRLGAREQDSQIIITLPGDVLFDFDKSEIRADAREALAQISEVLAALPDAPVKIIGHTDAKGSDDYNQNLSERRALSVRSWLEASGINGSTMTPSGEGEAMPVAPNQNPDLSDNPEGRQKNRRVEFIIETGE